MPENRYWRRLSEALNFDHKCEFHFFDIFVGRINKDSLIFR